MLGGLELTLIPKIAKIVNPGIGVTVIPKTSLVIPYAFNFSGSYPLSFKLFCELSLIPKTRNRASIFIG